MPESHAETDAPPRQPRAGAPKASTDGKDDEKAIVCNVAFCPICLAVTAAQGAAPDAMEHLLKAAREFFLAARAVIDTRADHLEGERARPTRLEKIEIT
ncbi:MAG TPA: hypothetical protein VID69_04155 [Actinomycetota bacterium]